MSVPQVPPTPTNEVGGEVVLPLTGDTPRGERVEGQGPVLNGGAINVRLTNPSLYWKMMVSGAVMLLMALNFWLLNPTFFIYDQSNDLWAGCFTTLGVGLITFASVRRNLWLLRLWTAVSALYLLTIAMGTCQPYVDYLDTGEKPASLQLPILYMVWGLYLWRELLEPFINPWTARRDV